MKVIVVIFSFFLYSFGLGQSHTDLKEYGYKGNVKAIVAFNYDTLGLSKKSNKILDTANWRSKIIYRFNKNGNIDKIETFIKLPQRNDTTFYDKTIFNYENQTRIGYKMNIKEEITATIKYKWISDTSYTTSEINNSGQTDLITVSHLNKSFRDKSGKYTAFTTDNKVDYGESYVNIIDENNLLKKSIKTNIVSYKLTIVQYKYFDFDDKGNPQKIFLINDDTGAIYRIVIRKFEYY